MAADAAKPKTLHTGLRIRQRRALVVHREWIVSPCDVVLTGGADWHGPLPVVPSRCWRPASVRSVRHAFSGWHAASSGSPGGCSPRAWAVDAVQSVICGLHRWRTQSCDFSRQVRLDAPQALGLSRLASAARLRISRCASTPPGVINISSSTSSTCRPAPSASPSAFFCLA